MPQIYDKQILAEIERTIPEEFEKTASHRFRSADDLVPRIVHFARILEQVCDGSAMATFLNNVSANYHLVRLEQSAKTNFRRLARVVRRRQAVCCINDDVDNGFAARLQPRLLP